MKKYKINISDEPHCNELESIGSIFIPIIKDMISAEDLLGTDIILNWKDIVGKDLAVFCNPLKTKFDSKKNCRTLYVEVPAGGFALEVQHNEKYILDKINAYIGYQAVQKLNIMQNMSMQPRLISVEESNTKNNEVKLTEEQEKYLQSISEEIKDEKLRKILINIGQNVLTEKKE